MKNIFIILALVFCSLQVRGQIFLSEIQDTIGKGYVPITDYDPALATYIQKYMLLQDYLRDSIDWGIGTLDLNQVLTNGNDAGGLDAMNFAEVEADEFIGDLRGAVLFKAQAGETLAKGDVVYVSGISGNTTIVSKADADDATKMPAFGVVAAAASSPNPVDIYTFGTLSNLNTSAFTIGDILYVSTTAGQLTATPPTGESALLQNIAKVTRVDNSAGSIKISGAGRTNATPNLNTGRLFVGNASNQAVADGTMYVDIANARVGIGTSTPSVKFEVDGGDAVIRNSANTNLKVWDDAPSGGGWVSMNANRGTNQIVGATIGVDWTTTPNLGKLESIINGDSYILHTKDYVDGTETVSLRETVLNEGGLDIDFRVESTTSTNALFVDASTNRVGIGTSSPDAKLEIQDGHVHTDLSGLSGAVGRTAFQTTVSSDNDLPTWIIESDGAGVADRISIYSNDLSAAVARIAYDQNSWFNEGGGNLGIGLINPSQKLQVAGNIFTTNDGTTRYIRSYNSTGAWSELTGIGLRTDGAMSIYSNDDRVNSMFLGLPSAEWNNIVAYYSGSFNFVDSDVTVATLNSSGLDLTTVPTENTDNILTYGSTGLISQRTLADITAEIVSDPSLDLEQVLTNGNDAGGQAADNFSTISIGTTIETGYSLYLRETSPNIGFYDTDITSPTNYISGNAGHLAYGVDPTSIGSYFHLWYGNGSEIMRLTDTGNLGIGTSSASVQLHVKDDVWVEDDVFIGDNGTSIYNTTIRDWNSGDTDIDGLMPSSTAGAIIEFPYQFHGVFGLRSNGGDGIAFLSGGGNYSTDQTYDTVLMYLEAAGDVGIGLSNPSQKLEVAGNVFTSNNGTSNYFRAYHSDGSYANLTGYGIELSRSASYIRPTASGTNDLFIGSSILQWDEIDLNYDNNISFFYNGNLLMNLIGDLSLFDSGGTEDIRLNPNGDSYVMNDLGIGTSVPSAKLHVETLTSAGAFINFDGTSNTEYGLRIESNSNGGNFETDFTNGTTALLDLYANSSVVSGGDLFVARTQNATPLFLIKGTGNIGVGTSSPSKQLTIQSDGNAESLIETTIDALAATTLKNADAQWRIGVESFDDGLIFRQQDAGYTVGEALKLGADLNVRVYNNLRVDAMTQDDAESQVVVWDSGTNNLRWRDVSTIGDGDGIYDGSGSLSSSTTVTINSHEINFVGSTDEFGINAFGQTSWTEGSNSSTIFQSTTGFYIQNATSSGSIHLRTGSPSSTALLVRYDGNIGIGTLNPDKLLVVEGANSEIVINDTSNAPELRFRNSGATSGSITMTSNQHMRFLTGGTSEQMRITDAGLIGINITSPNAHLDVGGRIESTSHIVSGVGSGGVAMTINDGKGNANLTFNHTAGVPEQAGAAARIEVNTDATTNAYMYFELKENNATSSINLVNALTLFQDDAVSTTSAYAAVNDNTPNHPFTVAWNGSQYFRVETDGDLSLAHNGGGTVSIGHTSPDATKVLDVVGDTKLSGDLLVTDGTRIFNITQNVNGTQIGDVSGSGGNDLNLQSNSVTRINIEAEGRININDVINLNPLSTAPNSGTEQNGDIYLHNTGSAYELRVWNGSSWQTL